MTETSLQKEIAMARTGLKLFSQEAQSILGQVDATAATLKFVAECGPLEKEIRTFLVSVASLLKCDCQIRDWKQDFPADDDGYIYVRLFPKSWDLPKVGPVAFSVTWSNPFADDPEDLSVDLRIPWNWSHAEGLRNLVAQHIPEGFTNVYDGEADASVPYWRYLRLQDFVEGSRFDVESFYQAILAAFRGLLSLRPVVDDYISRCGDVLEVRTARRQLGVVAVVDTETVGAEQELVELAVVTAPYDRDSGALFGILEQYEGLRQPACRIPASDQRLNGLGLEQVRGKVLDEKRIRSLLTRADFVVAHNAPFDRARLVEQFKWAADLDWRDSLNGIAWESDTRDLQTLLVHHGIDCETPHRAGSDARALLELLSYSSGGRTYLAQLLSRAAVGAGA